MKANEEIKPVVIFSGTIWQAEMVKSLLANAEIEGYLKDEFNGTLTPWITAAGGVGSVKVVVSSLDYDTSKIIVDEYKKNSLNS